MVDSGRPDPPTASRDGTGAARAANLGLRFLLEVAALAALGYWGFRAGDSLAGDLVLGVGAPLLAAVVWGVLAAPNSPRRLGGGALLGVQLTILGAGAIALIAAGRPLLGAGFAALIVTNAALMRVWNQDGRPPGSTIGPA